MAGGLGPDVIDAAIPAAVRARVPGYGRQATQAEDAGAPPRHGPTRPSRTDAVFHPVDAPEALMSDTPTARPIPPLTPLPLTPIVPIIPPIPLLPTVRSGWALAPVTVDGVLGTTQWAGAGQMTIPGGKLLAKNDATYLYVALDLTADTGNDPGTGDYFWFSVDVDRDRTISAHRDVNYGVYPGQPNRIGRQYYLGPSTWTGILNEVSPARCAIGFGPSSNSATPHRRWELRIPLAEIGVDLAAALVPPAVRFGLRTGSATPSAVREFPNNFHANFSNLPRILLATSPSVTYPPGLAGAVMGGVGLIPATQIDADGYASTPAAYYLAVRDAPFGGVLHLIGNRTTMQALWAAGARRYKVLRRVGTAGGFAPIRQSWSNYRWSGLTYVLEPFGPDAADSYPLLDPSQDYAIDDLLLEWNTTAEANGVHQFQVAFFTAAMAAVPSTAQTLTLMVDNTPPQVEIVDLLHDGASVPACAIVNLTSAADGVQMRVTVQDPEGHLGSYATAASYGDGQSAALAGGSDTYTNNVNPATPHQWTGVVNRLVPPAGEWVPPQTCAYQFSVTGYSRVTNGYSAGFLHTTASRYVTLIKPGIPAPIKLKPRASSAFPLGMAGGKAEPAAERGTEGPAA